MLIANPDQTLNIALAGPSHFTMEKDGIAFWLKTTDGVLFHVSDSIPKRLFRVEPFAWYLVDVRYNKHLWSGQYNRKLADLIIVQTEIAQEISERLRLRLTGEEKERRSRGKD